MEIIEKRYIYEEYQKLFAREIALAIKSELEERKLDGDMIKDITADITFSISSIIDGETEIKQEDIVIKPILTFQVDENTIIFNGGPSYMHEEVYGWVYDI